MEPTVWSNRLDLRKTIDNDAPVERCFRPNRRPDCIEALRARTVEQQRRVVPGRLVMVSLKVSA
jgi:hypothetical protein